MITSQDLKLKNNWWGNSQYKVKEVDLVKRDLYATIKDNLKHPLMLNIVGLRRVGKSTILRQIIGHLLEQKINPQNIFYFIFDYSSQIQKSEFLDEVLATYFNDILGKPGLDINERVYIFLDEVQYIENWQAILKRYYDLSGKQIKFIVTGSQSMLLRGKKHESLAGRIFDFYLPPLSFREFLKINHETVKIIDQFDLFELPKCFGALGVYNADFNKNISQLSRKYIIAGQFPETNQLDTSDRKYEYILEAVIGKVLEDCIKIFKIEKTDAFKLVARHLINNVSSIFELKNISREVEVSFETLEKYIEYLRDGYVVEILYKYHKSLIKRGRILKKIYTPCINLTCALNYYQENHIDEVPEAFGKIIENAVYNILFAKYKENELSNNLSFWRQGEKEIDFIVIKDKKQLPIEVKFTNNLNQKELSPLIDYLKKKKLDYGVVVTKSIFDKKIINDQIVYFVPYHLVLLMM